MCVCVWDAGIHQMNIVCEWMRINVQTRTMDNTLFELVFLSVMDMEQNERKRKGKEMREGRKVRREEILREREKTQTRPSTATGTAIIDSVQKQSMKNKTCDDIQISGGI